MEVIPFLMFVFRDLRSGTICRVSRRWTLVISTLPSSYPLPFWSSQ